MIILTGHGSLDSAIDGMHLGVFDYMLKTSSPQEVIERIAIAVRKHQETQERDALLGSLYNVVNQLQVSPATAAEPNPVEQWIAVGALRISLWHQQASLGDQTLNLTPTELRMLGALAQHAGHALTYQSLLRSAQGSDADPAEAAELVKPHIYHLRQKIEADSAHPRYLLTVRGTGYMLNLAGLSDSRASGA